MNPTHIFYRTILNPLMNHLLRSRLHGIISKRVFAISYTGIKSGKRFSIPVAYFADGDNLYCFTDGNWWKNLAVKREVQVTLRGHTQAAFAQAFANDTAIIAAVMQRVFSHQPYYAHHFGVTMNQDGTANRDTVDVAARGLVMIRITLC